VGRRPASGVAWCQLVKAAAYYERVPDTLLHISACFLPVRYRSSFYQYTSTLPTSIAYLSNSLVSIALDTALHCIASHPIPLHRFYVYRTMSRSAMGVMPSIIEEQSELALVGSIEVEAVEGEGGESVFNRILYLPQESGDEFELGLDPSRTQEAAEAADDFDESYEGPETILDALTNNFMNSCVGCQHFYPKSALRRKTPGVRAVPSEQPIADRMVSFSSLEIRECKSLPTKRLPTKRNETKRETFVCVCVRV
jgi:hypothetical protein